MPRRHAVGHFQHIDIMRDQLDILDAIDLRDQDAVETRTNDRRQILKRQPGVERIGPHQKRPVAPLARPAIP